MVKNLPAVQETWFHPGVGKSPGEGSGCPLQYSWASQVGASGKEPICKRRRRKRCRFNRWVRRVPWWRVRHPTPVFLRGESHGQRSLVGYSPQDCRVGHDSSDLAHDWPSAAEKWWLEWTLSSTARDTGARPVVGGGTRGRGWDGWILRCGSERALQMHPFSQSPSSVIKSEKNIGRANWRLGRLQ